jgi:hypothetical protein
MKRRRALIRVAAAAGWLRRQAALLALLALLGPDTMAGGAPTLAAPRDLAAEAALAGTRGQPLLLLFTLPGCAYCELVRRNYLVPLARAGDLRARPEVREVGLDDSAPFTGFDQQRASGAALAARYQVRVAPTVLLLDARGALLAPALVGGDVAGMYGAYLDAALAQAQRRIASQ